jgi:hypothetical protein
MPFANYPNKNKLNPISRTLLILGLLHPTSMPTLKFCKKKPKISNILIDIGYKFLKICTL